MSPGGAPRVSILLTCFNHIRYLPACVEGIRAQTWRDFEIIAVDDGSTDGTREWLRENLPEALLLFNESNVGTYASLNRALTRAAGEFVAIHNDDDLWAPDKLARQIDLLESNPLVGLVHTDGGFIDAEGNALEGSPLGFEFPRTRTGNVLIELLYANKIIASAAMIRRACFDELGGFDEGYFGSGDWQMWLRIAERWEIGFVEAPLTFYRVHGGNASHILERIWRDDERLRQWIRSRYSDYERIGLDAARLRAAFAHNEACLGTVLTLNGRPREGRAAYARSLAFSPFRFKSGLRWAATFLPRSAFRRLI
jgi:glycosyltransferase involved in cell wall biosynthesis